MDVSMKDDEIKVGSLVYLTKNRRAKSLLIPNLYTVRSIDGGICKLALVKGDSRVSIHSNTPVKVEHLIKFHKNIEKPDTYIEVRNGEVTRGGE